jgi:hypothetical protein
MSKTVPCPLCGGDIHAIAGRCKHCKADLVDLRERAARHARAHAMGATVPPPPHVAASPPPRPRGVTQPPVPTTVTGPMPTIPVMAPPPEHAGNGAFGPPPRHPTAPHTAQAEPAQSPGYSSPELGAPEYRPPDRSAYRHAAPPPNGTPAYGLRSSRSHRVSTWSRRWPLVVSAVALLAIGISIGVLAERWRRQGDGRAEGRPRHSHVSRQPNMVPDRMPQPLLPTPSPRAVPSDPPSAPPEPPQAPEPDRDRSAAPDPFSAPDPSSEPDPSQPDPSAPDPSAPDPSAEPDPSNPGSRFSQPPSSEGGGDASAFRTFTTELTDQLCEKLTQCGFIDSATRSMCQVFADRLDAEDAAEKVQRGECSFNRRAADACLRAVADMRCDLGSSDRVWDLLAPDQVGQCADAYVCD